MKTEAISDDDPQFFDLSANSSIGHKVNFERFEGYVSRRMKPRIHMEKQIDIPMGSEETLLLLQFHKKSMHLPLLSLSHLYS